jgi:hypothetical protein
MTRVEISMVLCTSNRYPTLATLALVATTLWSWTLWYYTPAWACSSSPAHVAIYRVSSFILFYFFLTDFIFLFLAPYLWHRLQTTGRQQFYASKLNFSTLVSTQKRLELGVISEKHVLTVETWWECSRTLAWARKWVESQVCFLNLFLTLLLVLMIIFTVTKITSDQHWKTGGDSSGWMLTPRTRRF